MTYLSLSSLPPSLPPSLLFLSHPSHTHTHTHTSLQGQAVITETLLKNQQQQQQQGQEGQEQEQIDGGLATHPASGDENRRHQHLSSSSSSHFSDGFEVIGEEEPEVELCEFLFQPTHSVTTAYFHTT